MTREEQICSIARKKSFNETCGAASKVAYEKGFEHGAKWADENPKSLWIDVEEKLPESNYKCIVTNKSTGDIKPAYFDINDKVWINPITTKFVTGVTHWFPKPEFEE